MGMRKRREATGEDDGPVPCRQLAPVSTVLPLIPARASPCRLLVSWLEQKSRLRQCASRRIWESAGAQLVIASKPRLLLIEAEHLARCHATVPKDCDVV